MAKIIRKLINERALFLELAEGNEKSFEIIYRHYVKRLFPYVEKLLKVPELAEELIQEIFVQVWINRRNFADVQHPTAYLFSIANRQALKYLKKVANDQRILKSITDFAETSRNETEELILLRESREAIDQAVAQLPAQRRLIWDLSRNDGLSHEQIAAQLNISKHTVKNQMVHAIRHIRAFLAKKDNNLSILIIILLINRPL
ncbi:RNA polymerase sigma factor [Pedobacter sp. Leaf176]|uniref:RNA polymerase sigma factor n=1 Tax=Pedobacter sp. Leaf176 TaxID=1736286 RepID=UPI0006F8529D|nr:RNA polymerase sigma-70 factor [Pedobacter sp. Leaf176]KQR66966.1 RNA polymerase subunit sigma-70 [Pedobacter sp. Leaf176]